MHITFGSSKLKKICESERELQRNFGGHARAIEKRLLALRAAETLADIPAERPFRCHEYSGGLKGYFTVDTKDQYRMLFYAINPPLKEDGGIDPGKVKKICIKDVHYDPH
jgi:proteic killer suppression protein